jgi:hypothetical protein
MMLFIKCGRLFALHAEWAKGFSPRPFFKIHHCKGETIFDMPYCRVIFTPGNRMNGYLGSGDYGRRDQTFSGPAAGAAED